MKVFGGWNEYLRKKTALRCWLPLQKPKDIDRGDRRNECDRWKEVDYRYMTEESDESSSASVAVIVQHKLLWRSDYLNTLVNELDSRHEEKVRKEGETMPRKPREDGVPSTSIEATSGCTIMGCQTG